MPDQYTEALGARVALIEDDLLRLLDRVHALEYARDPSPKIAKVPAAAATKRPQTKPADR